MATPQRKAGNEKRGVIYLVVGNSEEPIKLRRDATIIGREKGDVIIDDKEVSATHCQIQNINDVYHIFDMNSTNGTFINNERIIKAKLKVGDLIRVGSTSFRFEVEDEKRVRHVATVFKQQKKENLSKTSTASLVDTLIEGELKNTQSFKLKLTIIYHDGTKEDIELRQNILYLGRASSFGKFDQDPEISRKHLLIKINNNGEIFVEDQGSTNGSFINNKKIKGLHPVSEMDEIRIGTCRVKVVAVRLPS